MYENNTLGKSVRLLIKESILFYHNLKKKNKNKCRFEEIINFWIDSLKLIHDIPRDISKEFQEVIMECIHNRIFLSEAQNELAPDEYLQSSDD